MLYQGQGITCQEIEDAVFELKFDLKGESVNKFNRLLLAELTEAIGLLAAHGAIQGLLITSGKETFIAGADITEFISHFHMPEDEFKTWVQTSNRLFCQLEDLPFPTVTAINGFALGGGLEMALATCYRVLTTTAKVGLPETTLGIFPGWGGTVRLSRLIGADNAIEWIASGKQYPAQEAFKAGVADAVVDVDKLRPAALDLLQRAIAGDLDWQARHQEKIEPLKLNATERGLVFTSAKGFVAAKAGPHYPAPVAAITAMEKGAALTRDEALAVETKLFCEIAKTPTATMLVNLFLGDQALKKIAKKTAEVARTAKSVGVLGAGIMGGGIAYQAAYKNLTAHVKDINEKALMVAWDEATKLLAKQMDRGRINNREMAQVLGRIRPTLVYEPLHNVDIVIEAVVENQAVKQSVLQAAELVIRQDTVLASNTSTISISELARGLKRPGMLCGIHFFNPVHKMPLVEIIRGDATFDHTIATAVSLALAMGKKPIVVNDCPGFLINRVLFPYFGGFMKLLAEGVDFQVIDAVMESFGWPMGPAYLLDVVGIDTACHGSKVMASAYPDRMQYAGKTAIDLLFASGRLGQKNGKGFYQYTTDKKGRQKKSPDDDVGAILKPLVKAQPTKLSEQEIIDRMMLPMLIESSRCLQDGIVATPVEVDMGLIYGLGFPPFRGGIFHYADSVGLHALIAKANSLSKLGALYKPTQHMQDYADSNTSFYATAGQRVEQ